MKASILYSTITVILFAAGFASGYLFRGAAPETANEMTQQGDETSARTPTTADRRIRHDRRESSREDDENSASDLTNENEDESRRQGQHAQILAEVQAAAAGGDHSALHEALEELIHAGEALSEEDIEMLGSLLDTVKGEGIELVARALVQNGGLAGFEVVMDFAGDPELSVENRAIALESLAHAPQELAEQILPTLSDFIESEIPRQLQHTAAHALGRFMEDQAVDTLLGLLEERPAINPDVIFDAIAATGTGEDTDTLLEMLSGNLDRRSRVGLLQAVSGISVREGNTAVLLDLLMEAPDRLAREIISEAIADSSHRMKLSTLRQALELTAGDEHAQGQIARALAHQGGRAGLDVLIEAMNDPKIALDKRTLAHALHEYDGRDAVPLMLDLMRQSHDGEATEVLAFGIARNGNTSSMNELMTMLDVGNDQQRMAVAHALGEASSGAVPLDRLVDALRVEEHPEVSSGIARSIERLYGSEGINQVTDLLDGTENVERRQAMLWGLEESWEHNPVQARELYVRLAGQDPAPEIRHHAIEVLQDRDDPSLLPSLEQMLVAESDPELRERLQEAIHSLDSRR